MSDRITRYRIFIATPGGLEEERHAFRDVLMEYNEAEDDRGVFFKPVGWEDTLGGTGRPQGLINKDLRQCDYMVLILWDRWGSSPAPGGKSVFTSGCEEEFHLARECLATKKHPMQEIVVLFKAVDPGKLADPGQQLQKVLEFKKTLEITKTHLFMTFDELAVFRKYLRRYLASWVREHEAKSSPRRSDLLTELPEERKEIKHISSSARPTTVEDAMAGPDEDSGTKTGRSFD